MYSDNELLTRLQNGEKAEDIAKEMTERLNKAVSAAEAEAKAKKEKEASLKNLEKAAECINEYTQVSYDPEMAKRLEVTAEDLKDLLDVLVELGDMLTVFNYRSNSKKKEDKFKTTSDPIAEFLKSFGL